MLNLQLNNGILPTIMALILLIIITEVADA
jgi:hypothetical protein